MDIGSGIAEFVIGEVLAFTINVDLGGAVDLSLIGYSHPVVRAVHDV